MVNKNRFLVGLNRLFLPLRDAVFPLKCLACDTLFLRQTGPDYECMISEKAVYARMTTLVLCERCRQDVQTIQSPVCPRCGLMFTERFSDDHLCGNCLAKPGKIHFARALGAYDRSLKQLILAFKYRGKLQAARPLGRLLFDLYCRCYPEKDTDGDWPDLVIPVPLHKKRFRQRGFNQAWMLIRKWPAWLDKTAGHEKPEFVKDGLVRHRWTEPQVGLDWKKRRFNIKGAISQSSRLDVRGKHVLLIDDVYTTGATAEECAAVLSRNGARKIDILTLSRTLEPGGHA